MGLARRDPGQSILGLDSEVGSLRGIGPKRSAALAGRGIATVRDAIFHLPSRYQDWREVKAIHELIEGATATVAGEMGALAERPMPGNRWRRLVSGSVTDADGARIRVVWFNAPAHMSTSIPAHQRILAHGRVTRSPDGTLEMAHPEVLAADSGERPALRAHYGLPAEVGSRIFSQAVHEALDRVGDRIEGALPEELRAAAGIESPGAALRYLHLPPADADLDALRSGRTPAHRALALDEMFAFQLALHIERGRAARRAAIAFTEPRRLSAAFIDRLPFRPTAAQTRAIEEIGANMARSHQMNRILIGEVGSGKTLVAIWAALRALECGFQAAMMAPTELLAEQHFNTFRRLCDPLGVRAELLSARVTGASRDAVLDDLAEGRIAVVFGTHALIRAQVRIPRLGLAIVDEQHRFGVFDRAGLKALGPRADMLLMSATPIPRSLALTLLANLDVSTLDEMPAGRAAVATRILEGSDLDSVHTLVRDELAHGGRAYYVFPEIESDDEDAPTVIAAGERLVAEALGDWRVGVLHGRMRSAEKEAVMRQFRDGAIQVLIATTLIEVGIDVPEATVMVVIAAERFGLAQLHQLRGRVGRGERRAHCCLVVSAGADERARARLDVMARATSGAEIARADLEMRGPGDLFGSRQSGPLPLRFAGFIHETGLIEQARELAERWLACDSKLESDASRGCRRALRRMLELGFSLGDIG